MTQRSPDWRNYCIYAGEHLPEAALSNEDVIPQSLGGFRSTIIRASRRLNSEFGAKIDAPITCDPMVQFGRRDVNAQGHSRKKPIPRIHDAQTWKLGDRWGEGEVRYNLDFPGGGPPKIYDRKTGKHVSPTVLSTTGFVVPKLKIDHLARLRFTAKTLLGIGWKLFRTDLLSAMDVDLLRNVLTANIQLSTEIRERGLTFIDPFLIPPEYSATHYLTKIEPVLVRKLQTTMLIREFDDTLEWSIACLGYLVGSVRMPAREPLIKGDVRPRGGLRLTVTRDRIEPQLVAPIE